MWQVNSSVMNDADPLARVAAMGSEQIIDGPRGVWAFIWQAKKDRASSLKKIFEKMHLSRSH